jgi:UDP-GlcNAc3NAcA epimerase
MTNTVRWVSVVGARPQFVKLAAVCRALGASPRAIEHQIVHTGQHYDVEMSSVFFRQLGIPEPFVNLEVGSGSHGTQTAEVIRRLEPVLMEQQPDWTILYGDTNSTLAGAITAAKLTRGRIAHVESGLRSFNRTMPEEINRITADHLSHLLLCPTEAAVANLCREGLGERAVFTGDVMYDAFLAARAAAQQNGGSVALRWRDRDFALATIHRQENTDTPERLQEIINGLENIAEAVCPVVLPLHPRTRKAIEAAGWTFRHLEVTGPLSYHEMLVLMSRARMILTDSGGVQKEAYFANRPCITLRDETEWVETLANRCNVLAGADRDRILQAAGSAHEAGPWLQSYGDGRAGEAVVDAILKAS